MKYLVKEDINKIQYWLRFNTDMEYIHFIYFLIATENIVGLKLNDIIKLKKLEVINLLTTGCNISDDMQEEIEMYLKELDDNSLVFISRRKTPISRIQVFRVLNDASIKTGVNKKINQSNLLNYTLSKGKKRNERSKSVIG